MELEELIENTLRRKHLEEMMNRPEKEHTPLSLIHISPLITVIHPEASKKEGVIQLCKALTLSFEHTLVVGNSLKDWPMMSVVSHSCAVMNAEPLSLIHIWCGNSSHP